MKLYLLTQEEYTGYGTYVSAVVCAESEDEARKIHPNEFSKKVLTKKEWGELEEKGEYVSESWPWQEAIQVKYIGEAVDDLELGVVVASFNAG